MNCCDYDCNQGRDCPARVSVCKHCHGLGYDASGQHCTCLQPTKVARIGRKDYAREPLPPSPSRAYLRHLAKWMLIVVAMLMTAALVSGVLAQAQQPKAVDCRALIAGWHPDAPAAIQRQCRKVAHA